MAVALMVRNFLYELSDIVIRRFKISDYFTITGGSSPVPRICGENSGLHVYVDFSGDNPLTITVASSNSFTFNRRWHFHLQQIGCDSPSKGEESCDKHTSRTWNVLKIFEQLHQVVFSTGWARDGLAVLTMQLLAAVFRIQSVFKAPDR